MDEKDFEMLHVLNATRNITRAAEQLYMTQSALSKRIKAIEKELDQRFYRCHRSYLVNTDNIAEIDYGQLMIRMKNGEICPVATRKKRGLKNRMS